MLLYLFLLFTLLPALELYLLIELGTVIGAMETIGIVILTGLLGASLAKSQGQQVLRKLEQNLQSGRMPPEALIQAVMIFIGGVLLITPGIITDVVGFLMILPLSRDVFALWIKKMFSRGVSLGKIKFHSARYDSTTHTWRENTFEDSSDEDKEPAEIINLDSYRSDDT